MKKSSFSSLVVLGAFVLLATSGCGGDDEDLEICEKAFDTWCACPLVSCEGRPASCTGPDKEWAECINASADACNSSC